MACRLTGAKPLSEPMLDYWLPRNKLQWNLNLNSDIFSQENAIESVVCETAAILSRPQCVKTGQSDLREQYAQSLGLTAATLECLARALVHCDHPSRTGSNRFTHWGRDKMATIFQTTFWNAFSRMKMYEFRLRFHWSLFLRVQLTIFQHWTRRQAIIWTNDG